MGFRRLGRMPPPGRVTVLITDDKAKPLAEGVVADLSANGARIWSTALLPAEATLRFTLEFAFPPGEFELTGRVVWAGHGQPPLKDAYHVGVEWQRPPQGDVGSGRTRGHVGDGDRS